MSDYLGDWEAAERRRWDASYGADGYPQQLPDGTYTKGIGHTGSEWPRGRGHDYCWNPFQCISCGCSPRGPCTDHENYAYIHGWRPDPPKQKVCPHCGGALIYDREHFEATLREGTWFTAQLLRLIAKADPENLARLRSTFPEEIAAFEAWLRGEIEPDLTIEGNCFGCGLPPKKCSCSKR